MAIPQKRIAQKESDLCRRRPSFSRANEGAIHGIFQGVNALFISGGVSPKRLQIWKEKVIGLGGTVLEVGGKLGKSLTHVLASDCKFYKDAQINQKKLSKKVHILKYAWIEDSLKEGKLLDYGPYVLQDRLPSSCCSPIEISKDKKNSLIESETKVFCTETNVQEVVQDAMKLNAPDYEPNLIEPEAGVDLVHHSVQQVEFNEDRNLEEMQSSDGENESEMLNGDISGSPSLNGHITGILREMWDIYESVLGDEWRSLTYKKAVIQLEKLPCRISSLEDVKHLPGIGSSMVDKIKEILCSGRLQKLESLKADPKVVTLQHLASVWGVGPKLAQKLYQAGYHTVEDLLNEASLSRMAQIGVRYHKDLMLRIPREEVEVAEKYVQGVAADLCNGICIRVAGSYRRGKSTCGDIDFLATHPDGYSHRGFLGNLVNKLKSVGFISDGTDHSSEDQKKVDTFMGVGRIPGYKHYRRLDIKVYPKESYAFALVYFTGNDVLNRKIRYAAQLKGYKLNDQGLYTRFGGKKGISSTVCIPCDTEEEVFNKVGIPYLEPYDRNL